MSFPGCIPCRVICGGLVTALVSLPGSYIEAMPAINLTKPTQLAHWSLLALAMGWGIFALAQPAPSVKPTGGPWASGAGFDFDLGKKKRLKTRQSLSGMACNLDAKQRRICLMAFDEGVQARYAYIGNKELTMDAEAVLLRNSAPSSELDAEAAATDGRYFYVTGSHSVKRGDCASNLESRHVIRFSLDPATGRALRSPPGTAAGAMLDYADTGRLWAIMQAQPGLAPFVGERKCLGSEPPPKEPGLAGQQGVNIEGLAVQAGRLYFGFRGPVTAGGARVLAVDADALFDGGDARPVLTSIALGPHRGIRDMIAVKTGILLLAGPDDSAANKGVGWTVSWWDGKPASSEAAVVTPRLLAALDLSDVKLRKCDDDIKPEAMTVLEETLHVYKLLVLSDGMCDGGPLAFTVPR